MLFCIHLLFAITYLSLISIRHFKLCVVDYPPPPWETVRLSLIQELPILCSRLPPPPAEIVSLSLIQALTILCSRL